jgi:hypothetical protein
MDFGVFNSCFEGGFDHLPLLLLEDEGIDPEAGGLHRELRKIKKLFLENTVEDILTGIELLMREWNWRLHLLASITLMFLDDVYSKRISGRFWKTIYEGSWVSPQILVVLSKKDREFVRHGKEILESDSPVVQIQRTPPPKDVVDYYRFATERERQFSFEEEYKVRTALDYLIFGRIDETIRSIGGRKAKQWNEKLEKLIEKNTFTFEEV